MPRRPIESPVPRLALRPEECPAALGVGRDLFRDRIAPELRTVRVSGVKLYPVAELERWLAENAHELFEGVS